MDNLSALLQERAGLIEKAKEISRKATTENRALLAEEDEQVNKLMDDADAIYKRVQTAKRIADAERSVQIPSTPTLPGGHQVKPAQTPEERAKYVDEIRRRAFNQSLAGKPVRLTADEKRALNMTDSKYGGYTMVPQTIATQFVTKLKDASVMRQLATVQMVTGSESLGVVTWETDYADYDWTNEILTGLAEDTAGEFGKRELAPKQLMKLVKMTKSLIDRSPMDVEALVMDRLRYKYEMTEDNAFLNGTGANSPLGVFTASAYGVSTSRDVVTGSATAITNSGLMDFRYKVKEQYLTRPSAGIVCHRDFVKKILQLTCNTSEPVYLATLNANAPDSLWGVKIYTNERAPNTYTDGLYVAVIGDFSFYHIADSVDWSVQRLDQLYATSGQIGFLATRYTDGMPILAEAFARFKCST